MASALDMLGDLLQAGVTKSGSSRVKNALGDQGLGGGGGFLDQVLGQLGGGMSSGGRSEPGASGGGLLGSLGRMASDALSSPRDAVTSGNPVAVGGLGALVGAVLGNPKGAAKGALGAGGLALLAALARSALSGGGGGGDQVGADQGTAMAAADLPLGLRDAGDADEESALEDRANLMLMAMINAAKADGAIDQEEMSRIVGKLEESGSDPEARDFVMQELGKPIDLEGLVRAVPDQEAGVQVYAASLLATEADTAAERAYLQRLADELGLQRPVVDYIHRTLGAA